MLLQFQKYIRALDEYASHVGHSEPLLEALADVYGELLEFCATARSVFVKLDSSSKQSISWRVFLHSTWADFEKRFGVYRTKLEESSRLVMHSGQALQLGKVLQISEEQDRLREQEVVQQRKDFLHWLDALDFERKHKELFRKRCTGTGTWLLDRPEFRNWYQDASSPMLWCYGVPGAGKSVLAATVIEEITKDFGTNQSVGLAFAYCLYDDEKTQEPSRIIASLIQQLCWGQKKLVDSLTSFYRDFDTDARIPSYDDYWDAFKALAASFKRTYIILDGLDECKAIHRQVIIAKVRDSIKTLPMVKIWISSRREGEIVDMISEARIPNIQIEAKNSLEDIRLFVAGETEKLFNTRHLRNSSKATRQKVADSLVKGSNGM